MDIKVDWIIHGVIEEDGSLSYHTHGLDKHGMLELELNFSLESKQAVSFINLIAYHFIKNNIIVKEDYISEDIFTCPVYFKKLKAKHTENKFGYKTDIIRIIFQDPNFLFPWEEGCQEEYKKQLN